MFKRFLSLSVATVALSALTCRPSSAQFLDITSLTPGTAGSFTGTLGGTSVTGSITTTNLNFQFNDTGTGFGRSTTDNSSPQYSYSNIYSPSIAATDRVGYTTMGGQLNPATITITFGSAVTNPVFHVANLDSMQYDFAPTSGIGSLVLLSGNNGTDGDGIKVAGTIISDGIPSTIIGQAPSDPPFTFPDPRSAYGSVELVGSFTTLTINVSNPNGVGDSGSFTLSTTPEPGSMALLATSTLAAGFLVRRRRKAQTTR